MTPLDLAGLMVIAGRTLDLDPSEALALADIGAAQAALTEAAPAVASGPELGAAALLCALIRHRPWPRGNEQVAVAAATTFLALNGWQADLDPPDAVRGVIAAIEAGRLEPAALAAWLAPRLGPYELSDQEPGTSRSPDEEEAMMHGWLPGHRRQRRKGMFRRFSPLARSAVAASQEEARELRHAYIGTEHILLGLLRQPDGVAARALAAAGVSLDAVREQVRQIVGPGQQMPTGHIPFSARAKKVLGLALREAAHLDHLYIGTEHILLGLLREGQGLACQVLSQLGADQREIRAQVWKLSGQPGTGAEPPAGDVAALSGEVDRLRGEVRRLQELLLRHGIDPGEPTARSA